MSMSCIRVNSSMCFYAACVIQEKGFSCVQSLSSSTDTNTGRLCQQLDSDLLRGGFLNGSPRLPQATGFTALTWDCSPLSYDLKVVNRLYHNILSLNIEIQTRSSISAARHRKLSSVCSLPGELTVCCCRGCARRQDRGEEGKVEREEEWWRGVEEERLKETVSAGM